MIRKLKRQWRELREAPPGKRFRLRYERRASELPGPGTVVIAAGLALLAQESLTVAKLCDRAELAIRRLVPG